MVRLADVALAGVLALAPQAALAWGFEGHEVVAAIARNYLKPDVRQQVDQILAADTDNLAGHDMLAESTWADRYRGGGHAYIPVIRASDGLAVWILCPGVAG